MQKYVFICICHHQGVDLSRFEVIAHPQPKREGKFGTVIPCHCFYKISVTIFRLCNAG